MSNSELTHSYLYLYIYLSLSVAIYFFGSTKMCTFSKTKLYIVLSSDLNLFLNIFYFVLSERLRYFSTYTEQLSMHGEYLPLALKQSTFFQVPESLSQILTRSKISYLETYNFFALIHIHPNLSKASWMNNWGLTKYYTRTPGKFL